MSPALARFAAIWFMLLYPVLYIAIVVIAAAIVGYSFEFGRQLYKRRHPTLTVRGIRGRRSWVNEDEPREETP